LGIGDWGLGNGDWGLGPIPNPHLKSINGNSNQVIYQKYMKKKLNQ